MKLLFDFGGVLVDLDKTRCYAAFDAIGFDIRPVLGTYAQGGIFAKLEDGSLPVHEFCDEIRKMCDHTQPTDEEIIHAWQQYLIGVPEERLEMLLKIKQHYPLYVLSNTNSIHWDMALEDYFEYKGLHIKDFFEEVFLSYKIGAEKPDPAIFQAVVDGIGGNPGDILFFDDSEKNCEGARAFGMQSLLAPAGSLWFNYFDEDGRLKENISEEDIKQLLKNQ